MATTKTMTRPEGRPSWAADLDTIASLRMRAEAAVAAINNRWNSVYELADFHLELNLSRGVWLASVGRLESDGHTPDQAIVALRKCAEQTYL